MRALGHVVTFLLALAGGTTAASAVDIESVLASRYDAMHEAMQARNPSALREVLAADFRSVSVTGELQTLDAILTILPTMPVSNRRSRCTKIKSVEVVGETAEVVQECTVLKDLAGADGTRHSVSVTATSDDVWELEHGVWVCRQSATRLTETAVDGVVVSRQERP